MSLKSFHILFITLASLLSFAFGAWALTQEAAKDYRMLGVGSAIAGMILIVYGIWFLKKLRRPDLRLLVVPALLWLASSREALACSVCYGDAEGPLIDAARLGVWLLFGLVLCLQGTFVLFFVILWRRSRKFQQRENALS